MSCCGKARKTFQDNVSNAKSKSNTQPSPTPKVSPQRAERIRARQERIRRRAARIAARQRRLEFRALKKSF